MSRLSPRRHQSLSGPLQIVAHPLDGQGNVLRTGDRHFATLGIDRFNSPATSTCVLPSPHNRTIRAPPARRANPLLQRLPFILGESQWLGGAATAHSGPPTGYRKGHGLPAGRAPFGRSSRGCSAAAASHYEDCSCGTNGYDAEDQTRGPKYN